MKVLRATIELGVLAMMTSLIVFQGLWIALILRVLFGVSR